jgi:hypothetical protein
LSDFINQIGNRFIQFLFTTRTTIGSLCQSLCTLCRTLGLPLLSTRSLLGTLSQSFGSSGSTLCISFVFTQLIALYL